MTSTVMREAVAQKELWENVKQGQMWMPPAGRRRLKRHAQAMERGWDPYEIPPGMFMGHLPLPRSPWRGFLFFLSAMSFVGCVSGAILLDTDGMLVFFAILTGLATLTILTVLRMPRYGPEELVYFGAVPTTVIKKAKRDRFLFDALRVGSFDARMFETVPRLTDPFLLGNIAGRWYLGGYWDFERELAFASKEQEGGSVNGAEPGASRHPAR